VLYDPAAWPEWAEILQQLYELTSPGAAAANLAALRVRLAGPFQQEDYPNFVEGFPGVACSETHNPSNVGAWSRAGRAQDRQFPYFGRPWTWASSICEPWPGWDDDHYDGSWNRTTANPVLVVDPLFDPAPLPRGGHRRPAAAALAAAHPGRLGPHLAVQLRLHRRCSGGCRPTERPATLSFMGRRLSTCLAP
jgi:hypothetical protein